MALQLVTANRLRDGAVVYLAPEGRWSERIEAAVVAADKAAVEALLALAAEHVAARIVVAPYAIEVEEKGGRREPLRYRELIRARGPTVPARFGDPAPGR